MELKRMAQILLCQYQTSTLPYSHLEWLTTFGAVFITNGGGPPFATSGSIVDNIIDQDFNGLVSPTADRHHWLSVDLQQPHTVVEVSMTLPLSLLFKLTSLTALYVV